MAPAKKKVGHPWRGIFMVSQLASMGGKSDGTIACNFGHLLLHILLFLSCGRTTQSAERDSPSNSTLKMLYARLLRVYRLCRCWFHISTIIYLFSRQRRGRYYLSSSSLGSPNHLIP